MDNISIDRFENKPEFTSDLADFDNSKNKIVYLCGRKKPKAIK